jgi:8-oxo-dGTP pyrophosphatase MutT (NUDIX family)
LFTLLSLLSHEKVLQMVFRAYGIIEDTDNEILIMGRKSRDYLAGFLVLFGGRVEESEPTKDGFLRELAEESHKRVVCDPDDVRRFTVIYVEKPEPANLYIYRGIRPTYETGEIPHGKEISSVEEVSIRALLELLPKKAKEVTPALVADAMAALYGGGEDMDTYRASGIMRALREYLVRS